MKKFFGRPLLLAAIVITVFMSTLPINAQGIKGILDESPETIRSQFTPLENVDIQNWHLQTGSQSCQGSLNKIASGEIVSANFSFSGETKIEYLGLQGTKKIEKEGVYLGVRVKVELQNGSSPQCPFCVRLKDPSGETHQVKLDIAYGDWVIGRLKTSSPHWGGDENGKLEFPCGFETLIMDKPQSPWPEKGKLTVYEIRFFKRQKTEQVINALIPGYDLESAKDLFYRTVPNSTDQTLSSIQEVPLEIKKLENFKDRNVELSVRRQVNGEILPSKRVSLSEFKTFDLSRQAGIESFLIEPVIKEENGIERFCAPMKFSFAVLPETKKLNPWFGVCTHRNSFCLDRVPRAGIGFIRDEFYWNGVEQEKGKYVFDSRSDEYYTRTAKMGVEILMILDYSNKFYDNGDFPHSEEAVAAFARYCKAVAEHLKGRCRYFEIWNEWTGGCGMSHCTKNKNNTPENYVKMIKAASEAIRKAVPDAYIIGGGGDHHTAHFKAISKMMELGVMKYCDAFSVHPYVYPRGPEKAQCQEDLQKVVDVMKANGCQRPKLWLTEHGWPTYRSLTRDPKTDGLSLTLEDYSASMMARSAIIYKSMPEIESYFWYDLENDGTDLYYNENNFGMVYNRVYGCPPKASYVSMATLTRLFSDAKVTVSDKYSTDTRRAYLIEKSNGQKYLAVWTTEGSEPFDLPDRPAFGLYGNALSVHERKASVRPIFFELDK